MGLVDSVPAAFELTVVDARERLSFTRPPRVPGHDRGGILTLELDVPARDDGDGPLPPGDGQPDTPPSVAHFQSRRLRFRAATVATTLEQLQTMLGACPLVEAGFQETRVWMDAAGLHLGGRFTVGSAEAPFTIRVAFNLRAHGSRRLGIDFADVRLFGHLPIPDPSVGVAMARAIARMKALGMAAMAQVNGSTLDIDPLELALVFALVSRGWRLPDLGRGWLRTMVQKDAELFLSFGGEEPDTLPLPTRDLGATATRLACLEGERLPEWLAVAEELLSAGDLAGAEREYRQALLAHPDDRSIQARLLALRAAAGGADVGAIAAGLIARWPDFLPALLHAATAAFRSNDPGLATELFGRAAALAEDRGQAEDAALARAAATAAQAAVAVAASSPSVPAAARAAAQRSPTLKLAGVSPPPLGALDPGDAIPRPAEPTTADDFTGATAAIYARQPDPELRAEALSALWEQFARLPLERQHDAYASFGKVAESAGDLEHAEEAYWRATNLAGAPDQRADDLVAHARVLLSRGNSAAAVTELEEAADLSPRHVQARQALAQLALERHDLRTAAERLDEVLRLLPPHAIGAALEVRLHLMEVQAGLGDWAAAQGHAEFVLAHDPARISVLERLADIYEQQGLYAGAADVFDRLARLYPQPRMRAEALLRAGDILLERLGDETRAFDFYLESSDLDATFVPTTLRLISAFWSRGRYDDIAGLSEDLLGGGTLPALDTPLRVRLAVAVALAHGDADRGAAVAELASLPWDANSAAEVLAEMATHSSEQPPRDRDLAAALVESWRASQNA